MVVFNIEIDEVLRDEIQMTIEEQGSEIAEGEEFAIIVEENCFVGNRAGERLIIEKIISRIL
jgi:hypothetical protein